MNKKQSTRNKILDTVFTLVHIHEYNGTSMSMVLKKCGIPKGSLYHCFESKKRDDIGCFKRENFSKDG
ncbi:MAG: TetR/AcrR family transcriptional regulator [Sulfurimonas sp.]|nr:TetR/AcrR family transcriptional regulator [Sulfurimonas sp.]